MTYNTQAAALSALLADELGPERIDFLVDDTHWHAHAAGGPSNVLVVIAARSNGEQRFAVFSSIDLARKWAREMDAWTGEDGTIVTAPFVIDCPEFENIEMGERN